MELKLAVSWTEGDNLPYIAGLFVKAVETGPNNVAHMYRTDLVRVWPMDGRNGRKKFEEEKEGGDGRSENGMIL